MARILPENFVSSAFSLEDCVAAITGAGSGLGAAMAAGLSQAGATVAVLDIHEDRAENVAATIADGGGEAFGLRCDVTDSEALRATVDEVVRRTGRVDVLVNSAGTAFRSAAEDYPEEEFERVVGVNLKGTFLSCQAFGRHMLQRGSGSIVNVASIGGFIAYPHASAYLASKGGVVQVTRALALEWIGRVRVNGIAPTLTDTPMSRRVAKRSTVTSDFIRARFLHRELAQPHQVVGAAVFLASDASEFVTGHTLPVDGGYLIA